MLRAIKEDAANVSQLLVSLSLSPTSTHLPSHLLEFSLQMDAYCLLAAYRSDSPMRRDRTYETAERLGKERLLEVLGPKAFDDDGPHVGSFWSILETRPYMR